MIKILVKTLKHDLTKTPLWIFHTLSRQSYGEMKSYVRNKISGSDSHSYCMVNLITIKDGVMIQVVMMMKPQRCFRHSTSTNVIPVF